MLSTDKANRRIKIRDAQTLPSEFEDFNPLILRILSARGIRSKHELNQSLGNLPSPWLLSGMEQMVSLLHEAILYKKKIVILADFDADGATSCAVALLGLSLLGATHVDYVVPNRFEYGYGLTPEIVDLIRLKNPDLILTVDNGISSLDGVLYAKSLNIKVLVTDHHLPGKELPNADAIVNPYLPGDNFPSKCLAGVGVIFYVILALRQYLRKINWYVDQNIQEPNLAQLLDYVALGTVADVVPLDRINRILVFQGLMRIRSGQAHPGINALIKLSGRNFTTVTSSDLGFAVGPRLNAAGRMDDMSIGIQCLTTNDEDQAEQFANLLEQLNSERKATEKQMKHEAIAYLSDIKTLENRTLPAGVCLYNENWHQGVIGILASRIKDRIRKPVIAFAPADEHTIKGSARSIPELHIRDLLSDIAASHPKILSKFGGHAMAAGLTIKLHDYPAFSIAFDEWVHKRLTNVNIEQTIWTDGELQENDINIEMAHLLRSVAVWGHEFPEPSFHGEFEILQVRIVGHQHLKLVLRLSNGTKLFDGIAFFVDQPEEWLGVRKCLMTYKIDINEYKGQKNLQLLVEYLEKIV
jgi:single-stranded-DNA-specific exonuclease